MINHGLMFVTAGRGGQSDGFIGQYCPGNQPDHSRLRIISLGNKKNTGDRRPRYDHFCNMGNYKLAYAGIDDAGEMSSSYANEDGKKKQIL